MSPAVFPYALLPRVAYATFHIISDTVFVRAGDATAAGTPGAQGCAQWPRSSTCWADEGQPMILGIFLTVV